MYKVFSFSLCYTRTSLLTDVGLTRGDSVVVSAENKPLIALCMGNVQEISDTRVSLLVDRLVVIFITLTIDD